LAKLHVDINEEKSRHVDLAKGESFGFLGYDWWLDQRPVRVDFASFGRGTRFLSTSQEARQARLISLLAKSDVCCGRTYSDFPLGGSSIKAQSVRYTVLGSHFVSIPSLYPSKSLLSGRAQADEIARERTHRQYRPGG
jgi:hypothetical protein